MSEEELKEEGGRRENVITKARFSEEMQKVFQAETGHKISKEVAWNTFKAMVMSIVELSTEMPVSLSGVGKFEIQKTKPRKTKRGVVDFVPRFKFRASSAISQMLEERYNQVVPGREKKELESEPDEVVEISERPSEKKDDFGLDF